MKRTILLWTLASIVSLATAVIQRVTGPSYPMSGAETLADATVHFRLERSSVSTGPAPVRIECDNAGVTGTLEWRRHKTVDPFQSIPMRREEGELVAEIPSQPPAGKVDYRVTLRKGDAFVQLPAEGPIVLRFRGEVPAGLLIPHIVVMFVGMLFAARAGLEFLSPQKNLRFLILCTIVTLAVGGLILGPAVQKYAFGAWWTGWPIGTDLTDNKTAAALLAWLIAYFMVRRSRPSRWALAAAIVTFGVYLVPHSLLGSELDYNAVSPANRTDSVSVLPR